MNFKTFKSKRTSSTNVMMFILASMIILTNSAYAQIGSLDLTFDTDGKVTTPIGSSSDVGNSVAIQDDGKIVVSGYSENGTDSDFAVVRYNSNGSLDTDFGTGGKVTTDLGGFDDVGSSVALQDDGKIVVAGYGRTGTTKDIAVVRYNSDGSLDTDFDTDGIVTTPIGNSSDYGFAVVIQEDGKIVVAGSSSHVAVVRYNNDGSLDTMFDGDGILTTDLGNASEALAIALQPDGKIIVTGYTSDTYNDIVVVRYNEDGSLDTSFDGDGIAITDIGGFNDQGYAIDVQSNGKIIVAGISYAGQDSDFALLRYNDDGSLDQTFEGGGIVTNDIASYNESARSMTIQDDDKILVSGVSYIGTTSFVVVVRYESDGVLDLTFDTDGIVTTTIGATSEGQCITLQSDGKIVVSGYALIGDNLDFAVARYNNSSIIGVSTSADFTPTIEIYPNPFSTQTTIQTLDYFKHATITIYDSSGKAIKQFMNITGQSYTLQREGLSKGIYDIVITQDGKSAKTAQFVIAN